MGKFDKELVAYAKASGACAYAIKRSKENPNDKDLRNNAFEAFDELERLAFPLIEEAYKKNPSDTDATSAFSIASQDLELIREELARL